MGKSTYNIPGMKKSASQISDQMTKFSGYKKSMTETVEATKTFFQDERAKKFLVKYEELKGSMDKVEGCMKAYAEFLEKAAAKFDKDQNQSI